MAAEFMKRHFTGRGIMVHSHYGPICLMGGTAASYKLDSHDWEELFETSALDPYQTVSSCSIDGRISYPLLNVKEAGLPCKKATCSPTCFLCLTHIEEGVVPDKYSPLQAHIKCCQPCRKPGCSVYLPTMPAYFSTATGAPRALTMCSKHQDPQPPKEEKRPEKRPNLKLLPKVPKKTKTSEYNKDKSSHLITKFISGGKEEKKEEVKVEPPKKLLHNSSTGEVFAYVEDGRAYHIKTNKLLFVLGEKKEASSSTRVPIGERKHDFSPPDEASRHPGNVDRLITLDSEVTGA